MTFIDELLAETEQRELKMNKLRADQLLMVISVLEGKMDDLNKLCDDEVIIIETYRESEIAKLEKRRSWLTWNLEQFIRSTNEKTIKLPHGAIKLRLGRDKVEVVNLDLFMKQAPKLGFLKTVPESYEPDLQKIHNYIKIKNVIPEGVRMTPAQTKFSYTTLKGDTHAGENEPSEIGVATERIGEVEVVER